MALVVTVTKRFTTLVPGFVRETRLFLQQENFCTQNLHEGRGHSAPRVLQPQVVELRNASFIHHLVQYYWNRRFAIPGVWANAGAQILPIKWRHEPGTLKIFQLKELHFECPCSKFFNWKSSILSTLVTSLDGKNQFSMERAHWAKTRE